ncbi:hypothetical protein RB620_24725 [Paenibacillus sp. LHD-117]|uniref:hypothetical protein n=1 Tax=Paenibacillus sp. LHD-117 TaxID=3071412 RepID=UPI0027DF16C6|nr:hypothetical protein [Paenibacillus sp. LHD-117]MDQ6422642.1 hypothetical protein [Paenibacillus sp. LHD-117]
MKNVMLKLAAKVCMARKNEDKLKWEQLIGFGVVALVLWIIVGNSTTARTAGQTIITTVQAAVVGLIGDIGGLA